VKASGKFSARLTGYHADIFFDGWLKYCDKGFCSQRSLGNVSYLNLQLIQSNFQT